MSARWPELMVAALTLSLAACGTAAKSVRGYGSADVVVRDFCRNLGRSRGLAVLNLFADGARIDIEDVRVSFVGRQDIARFADYAVAVHEQLAAREFEVAQDTARCQLEESNDWLGLLGVRQASYHARFLVSGPKILDARIDMTPDTREELSGKLAGFLSWLLTQDPQAWGELLPGGRPAYDARVVPKLIKRLRQWRSQMRR